MGSIQEFIIANLEYIYLFIGLGIIFLFLNSITKRKYRQLFHSVFFLTITMIIIFLIKNSFVFILLPFFIFFIQNIFNDKNFHSLITIEENELFNENESVIWEKFEVAPELKKRGDETSV
ncbi:hypothetical protein [Candidatus Harpocratesius sp.]